MAGRTFWMAISIQAGLFALIGFTAMRIGTDRAVLFWGVSVFLGLSLLALSAIDWRTYLLPDGLTLPLIATGLAWHVYQATPLWAYLAGGVIGYGLVYGLHLYWRKVRGEEGIGLGDAKLLAAAGTWLGAAQLPIVMLVASGSALLVTFVNQIAAGEKNSAYVAFGPYLSLGFWASWCFL